MVSKLQIPTVCIVSDSLTNTEPDNWTALAAGARPDRRPPTMFHL